MIVRSRNGAAVGLARSFLTGDFFEGSNDLVNRVMRTPAEPALWRHVTRWMLPFQVLRGLLIALVLYPFLPAMRPAISPTKFGMASRRKMVRNG